MGKVQVRRNRALPVTRNQTVLQAEVKRNTRQRGVIKLRVNKKTSGRLEYIILQTEVQAVILKMNFKFEPHSFQAPEQSGDSRQ
jgi:hypothetical protein